MDDLNTSDNTQIDTGKGRKLSTVISNIIKKKTGPGSKSKPTQSQKTQSEQPLIDAFSRGESKALRTIYQTYFTSVENFVIQNSGNTEEAKDVFQDTLLVVYQKVMAIDFVLSCKLGTFIYSVARRIWQKKLRDERPLALLTTGNVHEIEQESIDLLIQRMQRFKLYEDKFSQLSPGCQELLKRFLLGESTEEVRAHFGYGSISYTKKRKCLCKTKLIKLIMDDPVYADLIHND